MKKRNRLFTILLTLVFVLSSVQLTLAKDQPSYFNKKTPNVNANEMVKGKFEKKHDSDTYTFVSGGGRYKLLIYTKDPAINDLAVDYPEEFDTIYEIPCEVDYGPFEYFSAAAGDPPSFQWGGSLSYSAPEAKEDKNGWYVGTVKLGKLKKNTKVGIRLNASKKCAYKFKIVGNYSPGPNKGVLTSVKGKKKAAQLKWKRKAGAKGYQIQYSKKEDFSSGNKTVTVKGGYTLSQKIKISKKGKYYFRVRAYKTVTDVRVCGKWSKVKSAKVR